MATDDVSGARSTPTGIKYLAFQGGGGKGMVYVGAIQALQFLINGLSGQDDRLIRPWTKQNQIKGVSGTSAGAITALLVCMGYSADKLNDLLSNRMDFSKFFDGPSLGQRCCVTTSAQNNTSIEAKNDGKTSTQILNFSRDNPLNQPNVQNTLLFNSFADLILPEMPSLALLRKMLTTGDFTQWIGSLLLDFGFCPGMIAVKFFGDCIQEFMQALKYSGPRTGLTLTFKEFVKLTNGVRLVLSGTNISQKRTFYFSDVHTPDFPVAAACLISMSIPPVFKPVWVDAVVDLKDKSKSAQYKGLWVDGGVLNNFPLHAFDDTPAQGDRDPNLFELERGMLALQLVDGFDPSISGGSPSDATKPKDLSIVDYLGLLFGTLLYPGGDGQIRSPREAEQTIKLYAGKLTTLDFKPSPQDAKQAQQDAYETVKLFYP